MIKPFIPSEIRRPTFDQIAVRSAIAFGRSHGGGDAADVAHDLFPDDYQTRAFLERNAQAPLMTSTPGVPLTTLKVLPPIFSPASLLPNLIRPDNSFTLGNAASLGLPDFAASTVGSGYVAEAAPIPMRQLIGSTTTLVPRKLAFGVGFTRTLYEHASAEVLMRQVFARDLAAGIEAVLLSDSAATDAAPAGLRYNISATPADAGSGAEAMIADLTNLAASVALISTNLAFIMAPAQWIAFMLRKPSDFAIPAYPSAALSPGEVICLALDAVAFGDTAEPRFELSREAVVIFEDTDPPQISTVGSPANIVAAPTKSAFQHDLVLMRVIANLDFALRHSSALAWTESVAW